MPPNGMYIPKLQAAEDIISNPALFASSSIPIPNAPYLPPIRSCGTSTSASAKLAEMPVEEIHRPHPGFSRP